MKRGDGPCDERSDDERSDDESSDDESSDDGHGGGGSQPEQAWWSLARELRG